MSPQSNQCISCARYRGFGECAVFPDGIPNEIITGEVDHTQPYPGDRGLQWIEKSLTPRDSELAWPEELPPPEQGQGY